MLPGKYYHVYTHANGFENLFWKPNNYQFFLQKYWRFIQPIADTFAYCLMPNHVHFLIRIKMEEELRQHFGTFITLQTLEFKVSRTFATLFSSYAQALNNSIERSGSLFNHTFKRKEVLNDDYFLQLVHYIHANPVNHGFVNSIGDWPWSSYHTILAGEVGPLRTNEVLSRFGGIEAFLNFHNEKIDPERFRVVDPLLARFDGRQNKQMNS